MATHLRSTTSARAAVEVVDEIAAGLEADPATSHLAAPWVGLVARGDALATSLDDGRRAARRARAILRVRDVGWDETVRAFERAVLDQAGGHREAPFYQRYFRTASVRDATRAGPERAIAIGRAIIALLEEDHRVGGVPLQASWLTRITDVTNAYQAAVDVRAAKVHALGPLLTGQYLYVEDINLELDRLEGGLQVLFPGQPGRVAAFLSATRRDDGGTPDAAPATPTGT